MAGPNKFVQALWEGDLKLAGTLLANFADVNQGYEPTGWTALHYAVENNVLESAKWLLEKGASPNQKDASGWTPLLLAIDMEGDGGGQKWVKSGAFPYAADMTELLLKHGANPNVKDNSGKTPLRLARQYRHVLAVDLLIQYGAIEG
ncbi:MAG TPA: ankyrin repeat domain-containing protein [Candidatus Acidoferrum sp.]|nr:ankyrin repeat domain-containing protein [Candidatus Acidoferrum sp.]